jgi:phage shock protein A
MGMPALKLEPEETVEDPVVEIKERLVRVETNVEHLRHDVTELKTDVRQLDAKLTAKIEGLQEKLVQAVSDMKVGLERNRVWYLLQFIALLGILVKVFK